MKLLPCLLLISALLFVGCGKPDLDDPEKLDKILEGAIDADKLQERGKEGDELFYAPNSQTPYTGWAKEMHSNGQVEVLSRYKGGQTVFEAEWREDGQRESEINYKDGKTYGTLIEWYENGQEYVKMKTEQSNVISVKIWLPDGSKCPLTNIKDGNGVMAHYRGNGQKSQETNYKDGKKHGLETSWDEEGKVTSKIKWKNAVDGKGNGLMTSWYESGKKKSEYTYKDGEAHGLSTVWHEDGDVMWQTRWENGEKAEEIK
jgi:antitoxin component YwqK of YwqJK toxin-antitoxin module